MSMPMSKPFTKEARTIEEDSAQTLSIWMDTAELPMESALAERVSADVCIVGAGIAGM